MRAAKLQIGKQSRLKSAAGGNVFKIRLVRRDEQLCAEKSGPLAAKLPGYIGLLRFNFLQVNSVRQENGKPRLGCHGLRIRFVNLNLEVAGLHAHIGDSRLSPKAS